MIYYVNGEFVDSISAKISINDLGFLPDVYSPYYKNLNYNYM